MDAALAAFGLAADAPVVAGDPPFYLWPEHVPAFEAWACIQTQWRESMDGRTGLDYAGVEAWLRLSGLPARRHRERFAQLQVMERAALAAWREMRQ